MAIQIRKTYRGLNPEMLGDEVRALLQIQGISAVKTESQTYALPSGATQSRTTFVLKAETKQGEVSPKCGAVHIVSSPRDEAKMLLDIDENVVPAEKLSAFQKDLDFVLGSYEVRW